MAWLTVAHWLLLAVAVWSDLTHRRIYRLWTLCALGCGVLSALNSTSPSLHFCAAILLFVYGYVFWCRGMWGGGDVWMLTYLGLTFGVVAAPLCLLGFGLAWAGLKWRPNWKAAAPLAGLWALSALGGLLLVNPEPLLAGEFPPEMTRAPGLLVEASLYNEMGDRSPERYARVIAQFSVTDNPRYRPTAEGHTFCNIFVWDVSRAMLAEVPHWVDSEGLSLPPGQGRELSANGVSRWLRDVGARYGWRPFEPALAQVLANRGYPVVAVLANPGGTGHVALLRPGRYHPQEGPATVQAGRWNGEGTALQSFGTRWAEVLYYVHL